MTESKRTRFISVCGLVVTMLAGCHEPAQKLDVRPNNQGGVNITPLREEDYPPDVRPAPAPPPPPAPVAAGPTAEERAAAEAKAASDAAKAAADAAKAADMQKHIDSLETQVKQMNAEIERLKVEKAASRP